jgi:signal transduction histidine kinase
MVVQNPSPDAREMMDILDRQVDVSARVIVNLLDFARPHAPDLRPVRLARVIEAAICECTIPQNVAVIWQADESLPNLAADLEQMQLVFRNLITNAVQAMSQGGQLTIAAQLDDDEMQITIGDTGVGIAPDALAKVFQPLFTTKAKGIGLGLALCRIIVEAHRGRIGVASQEGKGTTFTIRLPMNAEK